MCARVCETVTSDSTGRLQGSEQVDTVNEIPGEGETVRDVFRLFGTVSELYAASPHLFPQLQMEITRSVDHFYSVLFLVFRLSRG